MLALYRLFLLPLAVFLLVFSFSSSTAAQESVPPRWKGFMILGNQHLCAAYSDDARITEQTHYRGVQQLYFKNFTVSYVKSSWFDLYDREGNLLYEIPKTHLDFTGTENFFTTLSRMMLKDGTAKETRTYIHPRNAVVQQCYNEGDYRPSKRRYTLLLNTASQASQTEKNQTVSFQGIRIAQSGAALAAWSNGVALAVGTVKHSERITISKTDSSITIDEKVVGENHQTDILICAGSSASEADSLLAALRRNDDLAADAAKHWATWLNKVRKPATDNAAHLELYAKNLYAAWCSSLDGQVPADITGQFVTNAMPQLYPRDAMMTARAFIVAGLYDDAEKILRYWSNPKIPMKSAGEWYARYDAFGHAVDAGSGARYDVPEWDANGYFIQLVSYIEKLTGKRVIENSFLYPLGDFLVKNLQHDLLYEGGIIEWEGYLPGTNMLSAAALLTLAEFATRSGDKEKATRYTNASQRITAALPRLINPKTNAYADVRFINGNYEYLWNTSANFGYLWDFPLNAEGTSTNTFYLRETKKLGGGIQYFDALDKGLAAYGNDTFFFTTAAAAEFQILYGKKELATPLIDWMTKNTNVYGLLPERIYLNGTDCSPASPLTWCSAEFAVALLLFYRY
jgi:hypothetical protein